MIKNKITGMCKIMPVILFLFLDRKVLLHSKHFKTCHKKIIINSRSKLIETKFATKKERFCSLSFLSLIFKVLLDRFKILSFITMIYIIL